MSQAHHFISLTIQNRGKHQLGQIDQYGSTQVRRMERIVVSLRVGLASSPVFVDCVVDTGCPVPLLFPKHVWSRFVNHIVELSEDYRQSLPDWMTNLTGAAGEPLSVWYGFVRFTLWDFHKNRSFQVSPLLAAFETTGKLQESLIGLGGGLLDLSRLEIDISEPSATLCLRNP